MTKYTYHCGALAQPLLQWKHKMVGCAVERYVTVNYIKILSVAQQCFYVAGNKETYEGPHVKCRLF